MGTPLWFSENSMKKLAFILVAAWAMVAAAGTFYDRTFFYNDVALGTWVGPTNFTAAPTTGGAWTNGTSWWYRIAGTNTDGRTPWTTGAVTIAGGDYSNAVALGWRRLDGVMGYLIQRSFNGTVWTQHLTRAGSATNYTDVQETNWTAGVGGPTNEIAAASVPWQTPAGVTSTVASLAYPLANGTTASGLAASANSVAIRAIQDNGGNGTNLAVNAFVKVIVNTVTNGLLINNQLATWGSDKWTVDADTFAETRPESDQYAPYVIDGESSGYGQLTEVTPIPQWSPLWIGSYEAGTPSVAWNVTRVTTVVDRAISTEQITATSPTGINSIAGSLLVTDLTSSGLIIGTNPAFYGVSSNANIHSSGYGNIVGAFTTATMVVRGEDTDARYNRRRAVLYAYAGTAMNAGTTNSIPWATGLGIAPLPGSNVVIKSIWMRASALATIDTNQFVFVRGYNYNGNSYSNYFTYRQTGATFPNVTRIENPTNATFRGISEGVSWIGFAPYWINAGATNTTMGGPLVFEIEYY
jgi:hypothetical protein